MLQFEIPKNQSSIIKVIGVGGGGSNAVNYMYNLGVDGVDFLICNTDAQALELSSVPNKIQLGPALTSGLGAGANPEIGKQASEESLEDITKILKVNTRMAFITAGMGGGTGTGGAPVVAKICRDLGILTVGIVSTPFSYEGKKRMMQAEEGIKRLREHVDTILVISNDKLRTQCGNMPFRQAFAKADDILATAAKCITDVITTTGQINVDFADVCTVMRNGGVAILGSATASGENRAYEAVEKALNSPLLNDSEIKGAKWILLNINSAEGEFEHTMDEAEAIQAYVQQQAGEDCDVILGMGNDVTLGENIAVTVIATGFNHKEIVTPVKMHKLNQDKQVVPVVENNTTNEVANSVADPLAPVLKADPVVDALVSDIVNTVLENNHVEVEANKVDDILGGMKITYKKSTESDLNTNVYNRELSAEEMEEKARFEEQKRQLELRAQRLHNLNFNINSADLKSEDIENVPAYMRQDMNLNQEGSASEKFYSGYTVGFNPNNNQTDLNTINTFLDGKKPD
jgi:cell division protein FtsZ